MKRITTLLVLVCLTGLVVVGTASAAGGNSENAKRCQKGGWEDVVRSDQTPFVSQSECVSYAAQGGVFGVADLSITASDVTADPAGLTVRNDGPMATSVTVRFVSDRVGNQIGPFLQGGLPSGWTCDFGSDPVSGRWTATCSATLAAGESSLFQPSTAEGRQWQAEVIAAGLPDPDSTPDNLNPAEDDYAVFGDPI